MRWLWLKSSHETKDKTWQILICASVTHTHSHRHTGSHTDTHPQTHKTPPPLPPLSPTRSHHHEPHDFNCLEQKDGNWHRNTNLWQNIRKRRQCDGRQRDWTTVQMNWEHNRWLKTAQGNDDSNSVNLPCCETNWWVRTIIKLAANILFRTAQLSHKSDSSAWLWPDVIN